jgi:hypothetical protein
MTRRTWLIHLRGFEKAVIVSLVAPRGRFVLANSAVSASALARHLPSTAWLAPSRPCEPAFTRQAQTVGVMAVLRHSRRAMKPKTAVNRQQATTSSHSNEPL